jgi:hypothetical protein
MNIYSLKKTDSRLMIPSDILSGKTNSPNINFIISLLENPDHYSQNNIKSNMINTIFDQLDEEEINSLKDGFYVKIKDKFIKLNIVQHIIYNGLTFLLYREKLDEDKYNLIQQCIKEGKELSSIFPWLKEHSSYRDTNCITQSFALLKCLEKHMDIHELAQKNVSMLLMDKDIIISSFMQKSPLNINISFVSFYCLEYPYLLKTIDIYGKNIFNSYDNLLPIFYDFIINHHGVSKDLLSFFTTSTSSQEINDLFCNLTSYLQLHNKFFNHDNIAKEIVKNNLTRLNSYLKKSGLPTFLEIINEYIPLTSAILKHNTHPLIGMTQLFTIQPNIEKIMNTIITTSNNQNSNLTNTFCNAFANDRKQKEYLKSKSSNKELGNSFINDSFLVPLKKYIESKNQIFDPDYLLLNIVLHNRDFNTLETYISMFDEDRKRINDISQYIFNNFFTPTNIFAKFKRWKYDSNNNLFTERFTPDNAVAEFEEMILRHISKSSSPYQAEKKLKF